MKAKSVYHSMKAHDLSRVTRERGLEKPKVITLSEWADYLDSDDVKRAKQEQSVKVTADTDGDRDTEDAESAHETKTAKKGKG